MDGMWDRFMHKKCCNCAKEHLPKYVGTCDMSACRHCKLRLEREQRGREVQRREVPARETRTCSNPVAALAQTGAAGDASRAAAALAKKDAADLEADDLHCLPQGLRLTALDGLERKRGRGDGRQKSRGDGRQKSEQGNALVHLCCKFTNLFRKFDRKSDAAAFCRAA
jgi:hypothetical protein